VVPGDGQAGVAPDVLIGETDAAGCPRTAFPASSSDCVGPARRVPRGVLRYRRLARARARDRTTRRPARSRRQPRHRRPRRARHVRAGRFDRSPGGRIQTFNLLDEARPPPAPAPAEPPQGSPRRSRSRRIPNPALPQVRLSFAASVSAGTGRRGRARRHASRRAVRDDGRKPRWGMRRARRTAHRHGGGRRSEERAYTHGRCRTAASPARFVSGVSRARARARRR
jgi:hypothetical protein